MTPEKILSNYADAFNVVFEDKSEAYKELIDKIYVIKDFINSMYDFSCSGEKIMVGVGRENKTDNLTLILKCTDVGFDNGEQYQNMMSCVDKFQCRCSKKGKMNIFFSLNIKEALMK